MKAEMDFGTVSRLATNLETYERALRSVLSELYAVNSGLSRNQAVFQPFKTRFATITGNTESNCDLIRSLTNAANGAIREFLFCEQKVVSDGTIAAVGIPGGGGGGGGRFSSEETYDWDAVKDLVGGFGIIGSTAKSLWSISEGGSDRWKGVDKLIETGSKYIRKLSEGDDVDLIGFNPGEEFSLSKELGKYVYDGSKYTTVAGKNAAKIGVAAKWVGLGFSTLLNYKDNLEEYNYDLGKGRVYSETIAETALDVSIGYGTSFLASTILVAAAGGPVGWTAAAAAVVGVGITSVINIATEFVEAKWGIDVKEEISDFAVDVSEAVVEGAKKVGKTIKKTVGKAVKGTAKKAKAAWNKIKSIF